MSAPSSQLGVVMQSDEKGADMNDNSQKPDSSSLISEQEEATGTAQENLEDYETQFFGFTPKSFISGIYNAVSQYFVDALQMLEDIFKKEFSDVMTEREVSEKMRLLRKYLVVQIDKAFDKLEVYLGSNIFCVPPSVVLPEDQVHMDSPVTEEAYLAVQTKIAAMRDKILAVRLANAVLKQRIQHTLQVTETLERVVEKMDQAQTTVRQEGVVDLRDSLTHCAQTVLSTIRILSTIQEHSTQGGARDAKERKMC